jgi:hypothetical protein
MRWQGREENGPLVSRYAARVLPGDYYTGRLPAIARRQ